ncbi:peptidoglycan recognition protein family protein, partial [Bacillus pseudomycoides]
MNIKFNKKVVALTAGLTVLSSPLASFAEEQQSVNNKQPTSVQEQGKADQLQASDEQALKSIEASFEGVDGRGGGTVDNKKADSLQRSEGIHEETGTVTVPNNSNRTKRSLSFASPRSSSTINGVPFTEWIVPVGNDNIRPQNYMSPKYITIHETDNTSVGAGARNHAQYLYNQAVGNTDRTASWHFTVDDKEIYQHLPLNENGWHAGDGDGPGNRQSIAIEIAVNRDGNYSKAVDNAKKLVAYLMKETGVPLNNIVKHQRWSGKNCPANMINNGLWDSFVNGVEGYYNNLSQPTDDIITGWQQIDGKWYYFDSTGIRKTDWQQVNGIWYYFNSSGAMQTDWQQVNGIWYYFNSSGAMQTDWQQVNGIWYYFNSSGAMQT